jgi:protein phosphatase
LEQANAAVFRRAREEPSLSGMGTTMTLIELNPGGSAIVAHVGDSRAYLWHEGKFSPITHDHTVVAEYLAVGRINEDEVAHHPHRNMLTRVLGLSAEIEVDVSELRLEPDDRVLLCSDGLSNMITEDVIARHIGDGSPEEVAWTLVERANRAGGHDNITVMVVAVEP